MPISARIGIRLDRFEALVRGYLATATFLNAAERAHLAFAGKLLTLECGIRFLTDYLQGDVYFKISRPGHNLDRCRNQFAFVRAIEDNLKPWRTSSPGTPEFVVCQCQSRLARIVSITAATARRLFPEWDKRQSAFTLAASCCQWYSNWHEHFRVPASDASSLLRQQIAPKLRNVHLDADDLPAAFEQAESRGVRGGAICDYPHLVAARKAGAKRFHTLNLSDFLSFHRPGDPEILSP